MDQKPAENPYIDVELTGPEMRQAADEGIISEADLQNLLQWALDRRAVEDRMAPPAAVEHRKGFNVVTVAYYFGAMLMISACAWFLGDKWNALGSPGVLVTAVIYLMISLGVGWWLRGKGYIVGGGLLITVAVCLVPLITYTIEDITGLWPGDDPGAYKNYYPLIHGSWIVMELATIAAAAIALRFVRFGFLTAPLAFSFWFLSMDVAALILGHEFLEWNARAWIGVVVGAVTIVVGYFLDRYLHEPGEPRSEDFAFWCYLFGLMAFWGNLTSMEGSSELKRFGYLLVNIALVAIALKLKRSVFLVFGALGVHIYLGHLAYRVFEDSFLFPFVLAILGLSLILVTVWAQSYLRRKSEKAYE